MMGKNGMDQGEPGWTMGQTRSREEAPEGFCPFYLPPARPPEVEQHSASGTVCPWASPSVSVFSSLKMELK